jgi:xanthine/uracil/vitamin C permease (AzgA family)
MNAAAPTGGDFLQGVIALIIFTIAILTLLGMGVMMAVGAMFSNRPLVTSWPEHQEHAFQPFERRGSSSNSQAWAVSLATAAVVMFGAIGIYFGVAPDRKNVAKDMNMSNLTKKRPSAPAPKADAAPKPDAPAEAPAAEVPKP